MLKYRGEPTPVNNGKDNLIIFFADYLVTSLDMQTRKFENINRELFEDIVKNGDSHSYMSFDEKCIYRVGHIKRYEWVT